MQLVYLSPVPWASFAQRPHKFVEWFHGRTGDSVLWVDPYPTRFPSLADFQRARTAKIPAQPKNQPWLQVIRPAALPMEPLPGSGYVNGRIWAEVLLKLDAFASEQPTLIAIGKPSVLALAVLKRLKGCRSIYDAMDDFPAFYTGLSRWAMRRREQQLVRQVGGMLVSSTELMRRWSKLRPDVQLVRNGVDISALPSPKAATSVGGTRVLGYVGTIAAWFDWECVSALAMARPTDVVRLIGPVYTHVPVALPSNVEILPPVDHQAAVAAMREFDVGLIPFKKSDLTASVDPIKYYEYRALGVPVISTDFGEMALRGNQDGTFICRNQHELGSIIEDALRFKGTPESVRGFADRNSWESRFGAAAII